MRPTRTNRMESRLALETNDLTRLFGNRVVVDRINLRVPCGVVYGFLGPNGAGKTTTIRMLAGLLRPASGRIAIHGDAFTSERRELLRSVGALVETPSLYPHLSGRENLEISQRLLGLPKSRADEALALFELTASASRLVRTYSLGMRQRLGLALIWIARPSLLLLDEPANGLDPAGTRSLRELLRRLVREYGVTVFLSSHVLSEVEQIADAIGIIDHGRLLFQGKPEELRGSEYRLALTVDRPADALRIAQVAGWRATESGDHTLSIEADSEFEAARINRELVRAGLEVYAMEPRRPTLEEKFLCLVSQSGDPSS